MSRSVNVVILCEDRQHEAFARRFLKRMGRDNRIQRVLISPKGRGSGEQFVRERFAEELIYYRARHHRVQQALVVLIDEDKRSVASRIKQFESAALAAGCRPRQDNERIAIFVPARNIETWLAYLEGQTVNETDSYPRLERKSDCTRHVSLLWEMCQKGKLRKPSPPSLDAACSEYQTRLQA